MDPQENVPRKATCTLKVNIKHCKDCQEKAMKKLQKMDEVDSVTYDAKRMLLRVSGRIDPVKLMNKIAEWGEKVELYSFQKESMKTEQGKCNCFCRKTKVEAAKTKEKGKKLLGLGDWFCKKEKEVKTSISKNPAVTKWHFPRTSMLEYGAPPGPFAPPPYGGRPDYMNHYPPIMFPRPSPPPQPYPYGFFQSRPPAPPRMNPMIHYTSYEDNNFYYP